MTTDIQKIIEFHGATPEEVEADAFRLSLEKNNHTPAQQTKAYGPAFEWQRQNNTQANFHVTQWESVREVPSSFDANVVMEWHALYAECVSTTGEITAQKFSSWRRPKLASIAPEGWELCGWCGSAGPKGSVFTGWDCNQCGGS
jgi:hypothetical protein